MAYFTDENVKDRIHLLYFIKSMGTLLTKVQITSAFDSNRWNGYFETSLLLDELDSKGLLETVPCTFGQGYALTPEGSDTLTHLEGQLPLSLKSDCDTFIREHGESLIHMEQFFARILPCTSGGCDVVLRAMDHDRLLLSLVINLPDMNTAKTVCENWEKHASDAYEALLRALL